MNSRYGHAERVCGVVDVAPDAAAVDSPDTSCGVHADALHPGQVDDQAIVAEAQSGGVMASATDGHREVAVAHELHGGDHVGHIRAPDD